MIAGWLKKPNNYLLGLLLVVGILGWFSLNPGLQIQAATGINQQINYQGKMTDSSGVQVADQSWNFRFRIYDSLYKARLVHYPKSSTFGRVVERFRPHQTQLTRQANTVFPQSLLCFAPDSFRYDIFVKD